MSIRNYLLLDFAIHGERRENFSLCYWRGDLRRLASLKLRLTFVNNALPFLNVVKNEKILSKTGLFSEIFLSVYYQGQQSIHWTCVSCLTLQWYHSRSQNCFLSYTDTSVAVPIVLVPWALTLQTWLKHSWAPCQGKR